MEIEKNKKKRGSVLAVTLIIMGMILVIALGASFVSTVEQRASINSNKSNLAYYSADNGAEAVMQTIKNHLNDKISAIDSGCDGSISTSSYTVELKGKDGEVIKGSDCSNKLVSEIWTIKSTGKGGDNQRAIDVPVCFSPYVPENGVVGLWHFEEKISASSLLDSSGKSHSGTPNNTVNAIGICNARSFNGTDSYVSVSDHSDFNFAGNNFAIEAWVNFAKLDAGTHPVIISHWNGGAVSNRQLEFFYDVTDKHLTFSYSKDGGSASINTLTADWNPVPVIDQWYYVAVAREGASLYFYVNGLPMGTPVAIPIADAMYDSNYSVNIGETVNNGNSTSVFNGIIDEVRVFNNVTRTASDIKDDFCLGCSPRLDPQPDCFSCP
jgi:hypothetical protein